ncbi:uncharacterized protein LJ206_010429 [Theristicus caerulescens]
MEEVTSVSVTLALAGQNSSGMARTPFLRTMKSGAEYQTTLMLEAWLYRHRSAGLGMCQKLEHCSSGCRGNQFFLLWYLDKRPVGIQRSSKASLEQKSSFAGLSDNNEERHS